MLVADKRCISTTTEQVRPQEITERQPRQPPIGRQRDKKLFEIAKSVGYESDAAFSKAFKRVLGVTPGEHRRNNAQPPQPAVT